MASPASFSAGLPMAGSTIAWVRACSSRSERGAVRLDRSPARTGPTRQAGAACPRGAYRRRGRDDANLPMVTALTNRVLCAGIARRRTDSAPTPVAQDESCHPRSMLSVHVRVPSGRDTGSLRSTQERYNAEAIQHEFGISWDGSRSPWWPPCIPTATAAAGTACSPTSAPRPQRCTRHHGQCSIPAAHDRCVTGHRRGRGMLLHSLLARRQRIAAPWSQYTL
jgi:hypothetical protein